MSKKSASSFECGNCGQPEKEKDGMKVCARCQRVRYCDKACQSAHWKKGGHKNACIPPEACKPGDQPQEDRKAAVVCIICRGTSGRTYMHACRARVHLPCLADLFAHCKHAQPPCPVCRAPLPFMHTIFDHLADQGHFQECKELSSWRKDQEQAERDRWILFREARFQEKLCHWAEAARLFRAVLEDSHVPLSTRKSDDARNSMYHAEKMRDKPTRQPCLVVRSHAFFNLRCDKLA